jgi:glycosyltransferase involved in cell wall biosynthesis
MRRIRALQVIAQNCSTPTARVPRDVQVKPAPLFTVVICTRSRPDLLERCLAAVSKLDYPNFDALVVDNAPAGQQTLEVAQRWRSHYCVEPIPGLSRARNRGARECSSELVAFIDDDEIPDVGWLRGLAAEFSDTRVMAVAGRILTLSTGVHDGALRTLGSRDRGSTKRVVDRETDQWFEITNFGGVACGGNMAFRRGAFDIWPGFDVRLGRGGIISAGEEHRAFFSLVDRGYRVVYTPEALVRHPCAASLAEVRSRELSNRTAAVAYMALMLMEEPLYRRATLRYFGQGILGRRRTWRYPPPEYMRCPSRWSELLAASRGLLLAPKAHFARSAVMKKPQFGAPQNGRIVASSNFDGRDGIQH